MTKAQVFRVILFALIFAIIFCVLSFYLTCPQDYRNNEWVNGFFEEKDNTLDAVYIGTSEAYTYFEPPLAWEKYGIAVYNFTTNNQPLAAAQYIIEECRKTQPQAAFVIDVKQLLKKDTLINVHYLMDYWPTTFTKYKCMYRLLFNDYNDFNIYQKFEVICPLYIYHDRWDELTEDDISRKLNGLKGGSDFERFLTKVEPQYPSIVYDYGIGEIEDYQEATLRELCQYCVDNDVNVMFVSTPVCLQDVEKRQRYNKIGSIIDEYGLFFRDFNFEYEEIGINFRQDYYDKNHTNIYGAMKYTDYFCKILMEQQNFTDKRGQAGFESWDDAADEYMDIVTDALAQNMTTGYRLEVDLFDMADTIHAKYRKLVEDTRVDIREAEAAAGDEAEDAEEE